MKIIVDDMMQDHHESIRKIQPTYNWFKELNFDRNFPTYTLCSAWKLLVQRNNDITPHALAAKKNQES
jgi:hypothetical protein